MRLGAGQDGAQVGHRRALLAEPLGHALALAAAGPRPQLLDPAVELGLRLFHRGATDVHLRCSLSPRPAPLVISIVPSSGRSAMHAHDDEVSYTRIIDPAPSGDELPLPARGERPALVWRPRLGEDTSYELAGRITKLGRHDENDIVLAGPTVSARHATVRIAPSGVVLEDEGSLNGTFVNGERIEQRLLEDGDRIQVGPHLLIFVPAAD